MTGAPRLLTRVLALVMLVAWACSDERGTGGVELIEAPAGTTDVAALVRTTAQRIAPRHHQLVVYVGATWCEPCQQIHAGILEHRLDRAFPDLTLLVFDLDRDRAALASAGYDAPLIPLFAIPEADGRASSRRAAGGQHEGDNVQLLADKLRRIYD